ncbi:MarR family winged helix-turn-helix transcriptional regulator [Streptomyces sp. NPDC050743]|uniref:MarR family winged helix-turn-helix transcriptional regulator n=1 Tax=Streptomyces sp. NPDC050743 TaxID=3365634 RepID=UPI0037BE0DC8
MGNPQDVAPPPPADGGDEEGAGQSTDRDLLGGWMLVMQGFHATQDALVGELTERFNLGPGVADILLRLLAASQHRMPMSRLAHEAGMSSGGFTKLADRISAANLARRVACEADRRVTYLELTNQGQDTAQAISQALSRSLRVRVLTPLGRDGFDNLADAMRALRDANNDLGN